MSCKAIVFDSPTYMGGAAAQFKAFADAAKVEEFNRKRNIGLHHLALEVESEP